MKVRNAHQSPSGSTTPLLKWPGGKRNFADAILAEFPSKFGRYYEPFVGGGATFFKLLPRRATLSDTNSQLINCYRIVRDQPDDLIAVLSGYENSEAAYYRIRDYAPRSPVNQAARLLYLTRLSFNGIHRVNMQGQFNVPYGKRSYLETCDVAAIHTCSVALRDVSLRNCDFGKAVASARSGDLIYLDPPYTVAHASNGFVRYNEKIFSWKDQVRLAGTARRLAERGCTVIISNANHASIDQLYAGVEQRLLERFSAISASSAHRKKVTESLFVMHGIPGR